MEMRSRGAITTVAIIITLVLVGCGSGNSGPEAGGHRRLPAESRCDRVGLERTLEGLEAGIAAMKSRFVAALEGERKISPGRRRHPVATMERSMRGLRRVVARCRGGAPSSEVTRARRVYGGPVCERIGMERSLEGLEAGIKGIGRRFRAALAGKKKILPEGVHRGERDYGAARPFPIPPEPVGPTGETVLEVMAGNTEWLRGDVEACRS